MEETKKLLDAFRLRPAKHNGKEIVLQGMIEGSPMPALSNAARLFGLKQGDAIRRRMELPALAKNEGIYIYADGKMADWLEKVENQSYHEVRVKLCFDILKDCTWVNDEELLIETDIHGFKLIEVIKENLEDYVLNTE